MDQSEMFVLMSLIVSCLERLLAPFLGIHRPLTPQQWNQHEIPWLTVPQATPLAPIQAPSPRFYR